MDTDTEEVVSDSDKEEEPEGDSPGVMNCLPLLMALVVCRHCCCLS